MTNSELREAFEKILSLPPEEKKEKHPILYDLGCEFVDYTPDGRLTLRYPIKPEQRQVDKVLQGGYMITFFDNNCGTFGYVASGGSQLPTINVTANLHKGVGEDTDSVLITTHVLSAGKRILSLAGEARNDKGDLIATFNTNMLNKDGARIYF